MECCLLLVFKRHTVCLNEKKKKSFSIVASIDLLLIRRETLRTAEWRVSAVARRTETLGLGKVSPKYCFCGKPSPGSEKGILSP